MLDAIVPSSVFHVSYPSFEELIRNRIDYMLRLLEFPDEKIESIIRKSVRLGDDKQMLRSYFEIIEDSLRSRRKMGGEILRFIDEVSGGDMRLALDFFRTFLVSGNTNISEMMRIDEDVKEQSGGRRRYQIPFHHVIKSIILEHSRLYSSSQSRIMNLFELNSAYAESHFLHLRILRYLEARMSSSITLGRGYVDIDEVLDKAEEIDIIQDAVADSLQKLAHYCLIEFENQSKKGYDKADYVRITNTGVYYLRELVKVFAYLDLVWMDTPIGDAKVVADLLDLLVELKGYKSATDLEDRFQRTRIFLDYLQEMEKDEFSRNAELSGSAFGQKKYVPEIRKAFEEQRDYIILKR